MANPKRRYSAERQATRRANWKLGELNLSVCPHCKSAKLPHRACPHCGYYKGRQVMQVEKDKEKNKKKS